MDSLLLSDKYYSHLLMKSCKDDHPIILYFILIIMQLIDLSKIFLHMILLDLIFFIFKS